MESKIVLRCNPGFTKLKTTITRVGLSKNKESMSNNAEYQQESKKKNSLAKKSKKERKYA
jgi:hypothetical protein